MKVIVTGASGLLGRAVYAQFKAQGHEVTGLAFTRSSSDLLKVDLTDSAALEAAFADLKPDVIVHTAAERRPDVVESDPAASNALNVDVPAHMATFCASLDPSPLLINISTDYVFDGTSPPYHVDSDPNPLNAYGTSKLLGERAVQEHGKQGWATSLRVPVLYGTAITPEESAVNVLLNAIIPPAPGAAAKKCDAYAVRYPTNVADVAKVLASLTSVHQSSPGTIPPILHFSAREAMTKYDMCNVLARVVNAVDGYGSASVDHLDPEYEVDPLASTARPRHCKLDISVLQDLKVDTKCVVFESWWRTHLEEAATIRRARESEEAAAAEIKRQQEEAEAERVRKAEEAAAEERRLREEEEEEKRRAIAEQEALERRERAERERQEAESRRAQEEAEAAAAAEREREAAEKEAEERRAAEEEQQRREKEAEASSAEAPSLESTAQSAKTSSHADVTSESIVADADDSIATPVLAAVSASETADSTDGPPSLAPAESSTSSDDQGAAESTPPPASATHGANSPNPSFSSLRARPTPPATSAVPSPAASIHERSVTVDGEAAGANRDPHDDAGTPSTTVASLEAGDQPAQAEVPAPLPLQVDAEQMQRSVSQQATGGYEEDPGFFPAALRADTSLTGSGADDADSDGYGQPSPRRQSQDGWQREGSVPYNDPSQGVNGPQPWAASMQSSQTSGSLAQKEQPPIPQEAERPQRPWFEVKVGDPQKVGDPMTAHIVYTVRTKTNATTFRAQEFAVLRRYNDFRWLHAALVHCNPGVFVPPVPEKVKLGRFAPELVEARRHGLETAINKMLEHEDLCEDDDLKMFLESDNFAQDVKKREAVKGPVPTPEQKTYFGWAPGMSGPKFHEFDEWFESQKMYLDSLEAQLKMLVKAISSLSNQRRDYALATQEFSTTLQTLSFSSLSRSLSTCFAGLGELEKRARELCEAQSEADIRQVGTVMYEYERVVGSVRKAFATRVDAWQMWQRLEDDARKARQRHDKVKREGGRNVHSDRTHGSLADISEAELKVSAAKRRFEEVGEICKREMVRFDKERVEDFMGAVERWLDGMVERQEEMVEEWEQVCALVERQTGINTGSSLPPPQQSVS